MQRSKSYQEFWPLYLREHSRLETRQLHLFGTGLAICFLALGFFCSRWFFLAALLSGYGFAWCAHYLVEKNRPATFTHPLWSLYSDFRMFGLYVAGRLQPELDRHLTETSTKGLSQ